MMNVHDVIIKLLQSEKGTTQAGLGKYFFHVDSLASKFDVKKAVEELYKVHVTKVNTAKIHGRWKRVRSVPGKTADWKKAIVTLKAGEKIETA